MQKPTYAGAVHTARICSAFSPHPILRSTCLTRLPEPFLTHLCFVSLPSSTNRNSSFRSFFVEIQPSAPPSYPRVRAVRLTASLRLVAYPMTSPYNATAETQTRLERVSVVIVLRTLVIITELLRRAWRTGPLRYDGHECK
jgi:hypothetical protein